MISPSTLQPFPRTTSRERLNASPAERLSITTTDVGLADRAVGPPVAHVAGGLDQRGLNPEVADDADQGTEERPEQVRARVVAGGIVDHRRKQVEHDEDDECRQKELAEEPLVEAPGLTEHVTDPHACGPDSTGSGARQLEREG
jgi:hypothetical protein